MAQKRKQYSMQFKFKVALEAAKGLKTINQVASDYGLHPNQVSGWKKQLLAEGPEVFSRRAGRQEQEQAAQEAELFEQIGRLKMELEWLKKKLPSSIEVKRAMIEPTHSVISIRRQCDLIGLRRASYYRPAASETPFNLRLMRLIDEQYTQTPFYGYRKMAISLSKELECPINRKRVARLMQIMGLQALYPQPQTSTPRREHKKYPYLLRNLTITRPNQVWSADITYVPMQQGFMYLVAVIDWFSRFVLAWQLSNTLDGAFCLAALHLAFQSGQPDIFNTDQGTQFTAHDFTNALEAASVRISMDGRGRAFDNIFIERLWRTVKYEDIYLKEYETVPTLEAGLASYFHFYNQQRPHQSLQYRVPAEVHFGG